ncbi:MAG TPA: PAS domain-containing protein, partial [Companilactobacillus farciminis]|nr:PAS domain-containing protein [Companilactobacillus farciminis]
DLAVPGNGPDKCVLHDYIAMHDKDGRYRGVNEQIYDLMPDIKWYLKHTGQKLVDDPNTKADTVTGPSQHNNQSNTKSDATSGPSQKE